MHQHGPTVELVGTHQQSTLPRLAELPAVGSVHDAAAAAFVCPGVLLGPSSKVPGAPRGPGASVSGVVTRGHIVCKNRL